MLTVSSTDRVFILAGAGLSAESGIPTFRDVGGLWRNHQVEEVASPRAWHHDPRLVWEFYSMRRRVAAAAKPNPAHFTLAKLENTLQARLFVCTQNVDDLHEQAGSTNVVHMHGELFKSRCDTCTRPPFRDTNLYEPPAEVPRCECGRRIRPHICWFGEVPFELDRIERARPMHTFHGDRNVRCSQPRRGLCCSSLWSCEDNLRGAGESRECVLFHEVLLRQGG
jgi:NAD-dependent deacetylase